MWLIERDSDGAGGSRIPLPAALREALVRWYTGVGSHHDEAAGIMLVQNARSGQKWIACDCRSGETTPPILTPAYLSEAETYYLRRLTGAKRPDHHGSCPFFRDQVTNRITEVRSTESASDPPAGYFSVLRPAPEKLAQMPDEDSSDDRTRAASVPRLARLLWRLMAAARVNCVAPISAGEEWSIARQFAQLTAAAARIEIAPGIELGRAFWTHARPLQAKAVYAALRRLAPAWPGGHAPQGFLTLFSPGVRGHMIEISGNDPVHVANRVQSPSVRGNPIKGPFLVIVVAGQYPEAHGYAPLRAYAQPIFSGRQFVPVDTEFERTILRQILDCQLSLHRSGVDLLIEKPVFDTLTADGPCRPDFLLEARSRITGEVRTLVVEAMGLEDETYLAAKAAIHPRMRTLGDLITVTPGQAATDGGRRIILDRLAM